MSVLVRRAQFELAGAERLTQFVKGGDQGLAFRKAQYADSLQAPGVRLRRGDIVREQVPIPMEIVSAEESLYGFVRGR
jgi:hypothetical protein